MSSVPDEIIHKLTLHAPQGVFVYYVTDNELNRLLDLLANSSKYVTITSPEGGQVVLTHSTLSNSIWHHQPMGGSK